MFLAACTALSKCFCSFNFRQTSLLRICSELNMQQAIDACLLYECVLLLCCWHGLLNVLAARTAYQRVCMLCFSANPHSWEFAKNLTYRQANRGACSASSASPFGCSFRALLLLLGCLAEWHLPAGSLTYMTLTCRGMLSCEWWCATCGCCVYDPYRLLVTLMPL